MNKRIIAVLAAAVIVIFIFLYNKIFAVTFDTYEENGATYCTLRKAKIV